jgi:antitoxin (DNA-binding transcriptional repressor) of toxin-antitoxin stability system
MNEGRTLRAVLGPAAGELAGVERVAVGEAVELRRSGRPFARLEPAGAAFRLDAVLVPAALRTPDTSTSPLGPEWVAFAPAVIDGFAVDRASAWLEAAWRRAAPAART